MSNNELTYNKLPLEIQERMLLEQERQENKRNPDVFRDYLHAAAHSNGFDWNQTDDGSNFWASILRDGNFDCFFAQYPKEEELLEKNIKTYPRVMEVSNYEDFSDSQTRVVFMKKNGKYIAWREASTLEEAEKTLGTASWNYARDREVAPIVELTAEDISAGKGAGVDPKLIRFKER